ncbi:MAG TPA: TIR domain-containing protein [Pyrinomonadaceae bacterium]|nr:TIR domain-containing protein [Pyrinomonadaceae bacterium]
MVINKIFIGSSNEAEKLAEAVGEMIDHHDGTKAVLWRTLFPAGNILLEQIERLPNEIAGAILLATPDLKCSRNEEPFSAPVANIVFEYGYLSARLGRRRVSILQFDEVALPSDLQGVRIIKDNQRRYQKGAVFPLLESTKRDLQQWLDQLPRLTSGLSPITQVHGYSGTWNVRNRFTRWRKLDLRNGDSVYFNGKTFLMFQSDGTRGTGVQIGKLHIAIGQYRVTREVVNEVLKAEIKDDGTVQLRLRLIRSRIVPGSEAGAENADSKLREDLGNIEFPLVLRPDGDEVATLRGPHEFEREADEKLQLADEKFQHFGLFEPPGLEA